MVTLSAPLPASDRVPPAAVALVPFDEVSEREFRGLGLAGLIKRAALQKAARAGATVAYAPNDESNRPMLAVHERLGYRPMVTRIVCVTTLKS